MADDYYEPNSPDAATTAAQKEEDQNDQADTTDQNDEPTALVDKAFCPDMKIGQKFTGEVVGVHSDEYEIKYLAPEEDDAKPESTMSQSEGALDKMAKAPSEM